MSGSEAYSVIASERRVWTSTTPRSSVPGADETNHCEGYMDAVVRRVVHCAAGSRHVHADLNAVVDSARTWRRSGCAKPLFGAQRTRTRCRVHVKNVHYIRCFRRGARDHARRKGRKLQASRWPAQSSRRTHQGRANQSRSKDKAKPHQLKPNLNRIRTGRHWEIPN